MFFGWGALSKGFALKGTPDKKQKTSGCERTAQGAQRCKEHDRRRGGEAEWRGLAGSLQAKRPKPAGSGLSACGEPGERLPRSGINEPGAGVVVGGAGRNSRGAGLRAAGLPNLVGQTSRLTIVVKGLQSRF